MKAKQKAEAVGRMKTLGIRSGVISQFEETNTVVKTNEVVGIVSAFYPLTIEDKEAIVEFEEEYNALVYLMIQTNTQFGLHKALLYVSAYEDEWEMDNDDIKTGQVVAYVINCDRPEYSEFGSIGVVSIGGCLTRTW